MYACDGFAVAADEAGQVGVCEDGAAPVLELIAEGFHCGSCVGRELVDGALKFIRFVFACLQGYALFAEPFDACVEAVDERGAECCVAVGLHFEPFVDVFCTPDCAARCSGRSADCFGFFDDGYGRAFFPSTQRRTQSANAPARYYDVVMVGHSVSPVNIRTHPNTVCSRCQGKEKRR